MAKKDKYAEDGVDVGVGDSYSAFAGRLCRETWNNSPYVKVVDFSAGHYRGPRGLQLVNLPANCWLDLAPDGDGTKVVLVDAAGDYQNAARGWVAMTCGDITRWGGLPLVIVNNLDVHSLGQEGDERNKAFRQMMWGLKTVADEQNLVLFKGETAELGACVGSRNPSALAQYLWSGVAFGAYNPQAIITGDKLEAGMVIIALKENGFRNNGISSVDKAIIMAFGPNAYSDPAAREAIQQAATPAVLYDKFLATANGWFARDFKPVIPMFLIVHLTGGSIKSKLAEDILFPRGLSAHLNDLWEPVPIIKQCAEWRGFSSTDCYSYWGSGQGVLVATREEHAMDFIEMAGQFGILARVAGRISRAPSLQVTIISKFDGSLVKFTA